MKELHTYLPEKPRGRFEKLRPLGYQLSSFLTPLHAAKLKKQPKAVFIRCPRTGGTSINKALAQIGTPNFRRIDQVKYRFTQQGPVSFSHMDYRKLVREGFVSPEFDREAYKFTVVRNPYSRHVSLFAYYKKFGDLHKNTSFETFTHLLADNAIDDIGLFNVNGMSQSQPQTRWITDENGEIFLDYVGRFETIQQSFEIITAKLGIQTQLPKINTTQHKPYQEYYTPETAEIVYNYYLQDFKTLDYPKDLNTETPLNQNP